MASNLQQMLTWNKLSPPETCTLPQFLHGDISFGATMGQMLKCKRQLREVMTCTIVTHMPCIHYGQNKVLCHDSVCYLIFFNPFINIPSLPDIWFNEISELLRFLYLCFHESQVFLPSMSILLSYWLILKPNKITQYIIIWTSAKNCILDKLNLHNM